MALPAALTIHPLAPRGTLMANCTCWIHMVLKYLLPTRSCENARQANWVPLFPRSAVVGRKICFTHWRTCSKSQQKGSLEAERLYLEATKGDRQRAAPLPPCPCLTTIGGSPRAQDVSLPDHRKTVSGVISRQHLQLILTCNSSSRRETVPMDAPGHLHLNKEQTREDTCDRTATREDTPPTCLQFWPSGKSQLCVSPSHGHCEQQSGEWRTASPHAGHVTWETSLPRL